MRGRVERWRRCIGKNAIVVAKQLVVRPGEDGRVQFGAVDTGRRPIRIGIAEALIDQAVTIYGKPNQFYTMSTDSDPNVEGVLIKDQTLVTEKTMKNNLEQRGYGQIDQKKFYLKSFESLYLLYCNKLNLKKGKKKIDFDTLTQICHKYDKDILTKFLIYRDL